MMDVESLVQVAVILLIGSGFSYYIWQTLHGTVVPHRLTYSFWFAVLAIAFGASMAQGVTIASQTSVIVSGIGCFLIIVASFFQKDRIVWKFSMFDWWCAGIAVAGIILWQITKIPNIALLFAIIADFVITLPTLIKSYKAPETESAISYVPSLIAHFLTLIFLTQYYNFESIAMPAYLVINILMIIVCIQLGKFAKSKVVVV